MSYAGHNTNDNFYHYDNVSDFIYIKFHFTKLIKLHSNAAGRDEF